MISCSFSIIISTRAEITLSCSKFRKRTARSSIYRQKTHTMFNNFITKFHVQRTSSLLGYSTISPFVVYIARGITCLHIFCCFQAVVSFKEWYLQSLIFFLPSLHVQYKLIKISRLIWFLNMFVSKTSEREIKIRITGGFLNIIKVKFLYENLIACDESFLSLLFRFLFFCLFTHYWIKPRKYSWRKSKNFTYRYPYMQD